ncbi:ATP-binding protein [Candidatus Woesearchaeota archaeon]|nr:ATP-binding protein [Candidatus Woesearchaeota archaeon]
MKKTRKNNTASKGLISIVEKLTSVRSEIHNKLCEELLADWKRNNDLTSILLHDMRSQITVINLGCETYLYELENNAETNYLRKIRNLGNSFSNLMNILTDAISKYPLNEELKQFAEKTENFNYNSIESINNIKNKNKKFLSSILNCTVHSAKIYLNDIRSSFNTFEKSIQNSNHNNSELISMIKKEIDKEFSIHNICEFKQKITSNHLNLAGEIKKAYKELELLSNIKKSNLICILPENILVDVNGFILQRTLLNLFSNALKYSYEKTDIEVTGKKLDNNTYELLIKNQGIGIPEKDRNKLIEQPIQASNNPYKHDISKSKGIGLNKLSQLWEPYGKIFLKESEENKYAIFGITIPLKKY